MMRSGFTFFASFYEALDKLPDDMQLVLYRAIVKYGLTREAMELDGIPSAIWTLIEPILESAWQKSDSSSKTKSEQTENRPRAKQKRNENEPKTESEQTENKTETKQEQNENKPKTNSKRNENEPKTESEQTENDKIKDKGVRSLDNNISPTTTTTAHTRDGESDGHKGNDDNLFFDLNYKSAEWQETVCMKLKLTRQELNSSIGEFRDDCKIRGKTRHNNLGDLKAHFIDWMRKRQQQRREEHQKENGRNAQQNAMILHDDSPDKFKDDPVW